MSRKRKSRPSLQQLPSAEFLRECFEIHGTDLVWKERPLHHFGGDVEKMKFCNGENAGRIAGHKKKRRKGQRSVTIGGKTLSWSRVVWKMVTGDDPGKYVRRFDVLAEMM
jgi:hypothetical protein